MKIAYLDTIAGIAGDMTMAAFVHAGVSLDDLSAELRKLPLTGFEITGRHVQRNAITAVHLDVVVTHAQHHHRHLKEIHAIIDGSGLSSGVKENAKAIFGVIAAAEATIHNTIPDRVHFHEVGALDSIVDIVGTAICLEKLAIDRVYSSPVRLGSGGIVQTQHGALPTPTPATLEILRGYPTVLTAIAGELTTPTGAGIIKALSHGVMDSEVLSVSTIGYGAGTMEFPGLPNLLRVIIGEYAEQTEKDEIVVVETNIDDMNPQFYPHVLEKLLASGAHDAYLIPVTMKRGRPGILLSVLVGQSMLDAIIQVLYQQTTTIGVRIRPVGRRKLLRRILEIPTSFGLIKAKAVLRDGREVVAPEFEECRRIAVERQLPLPRVYAMIEEEINKRSPE